MILDYAIILFTDEHRYSSDKIGTLGLHWVALLGPFGASTGMISLYV